MFEDYIQSGENWMQSSLLISLTKTSSQRRRGRHTMLPYKDVKERFGLALAQQILHEKKNQEKNKPKGDTCTYFMQHPDAPGQEDSVSDFVKAVLLWEICDCGPI